MELNVDFIKYLYLLMKEDSSYIIPSIALFGVLPALLLPGVSQIKNRMKRFLSLMIIMIISVGTLALLEPESKCKAILINKQNTEYTLQHCKVSAFNAQPETPFASAKDAWRCPDGNTRYLGVKYRDKGIQSLSDKKE
ncbi:hypothetical protein [Klebsiella aerogenes]|uniref:hypothetical protein n=1 Tax=Klebsiella aerogenes TaxID=548 RepID=UPI00063C6777|nr:hypothetical protein [Klebsiella aerogenes]KLE98179.1 hypothetical protein YA24_17905 [Klebsiella aerogenes]